MRWEQPKDRFDRAVDATGRAQAGLRDVRRQWRQWWHYKAVQHPVAARVAIVGGFWVTLVGTWLFVSALTMNPYSLPLALILSGASGASLLLLSMWGDLSRLPCGCPGCRRVELR